MGFFDFLKGNKKSQTAESRREFLLNNGRICDGVIIDVETNDSNDEIIFYHYNIQGVDFESSEIMTAEQKQNAIEYAPGSSVGVRFDPQNHHNSIVI